jgi:DNA invertase Pin-like site-specific DNA recombinase
MHIAAYVRVSTDDQNENRQMCAIHEKYAESEQDTKIDWYCDHGESGASTSRREYQRLREHVGSPRSLALFGTPIRRSKNSPMR